MCEHVWFELGNEGDERVESPAAVVGICTDCVLRWFPGRDEAWLRARHRRFDNHVGEKDAIGPSR